jgi:predicted ATPase with chaperone activity
MDTKLSLLSQELHKMNGSRPERGTNPFSSKDSGKGLFIPSPISKAEDTGLSGLWLQDLILKVLYFQGYMTGFRIADDIALPFGGIVDQLLEILKREKLIEVKTAQQIGLGEGAYVYGITGLGISRAREALERSQYAGPAPVPLEMYNKAIRAQSRGRHFIKDHDLRRVLSGLVLSDEVYESIGPAVNSGTSIFLYGPPGNGKTSIARSIGSLSLNESMYIPYAIYIDGQVVKLFDTVNQRAFPEEPLPPTNSGGFSNHGGTGGLRLVQRRDTRWIRIYRPFVVVGGELTMAGLDLVFDDVNKYYEAPFQVKANGGILLIDDFGRQQVRPRDLLNRWIVPLENRIDYLTQG